MAKEVVFKIKLEGGEQTIKTLNGIEKEINDIKTQLKDTDIGSAQFQQLNASLKDAESQLQNFSDNNLRSLSSLEKLEGGTKAFAGAIGLATGAFALFGVENEKAAEALVKVQGALALANGVKDLGEGFSKLGVTTSKVSAGFKTLGNVVKGNPIILLAGVIVSLLAATGNLDDLIQTLGKSFGKIFEQISPVLDVISDLVQAAITPLLNVLGPLIDVLGKALVPILDASLIPLKIFGSVMEAISPIIEVVGQTIGTLLEPFTALTEGIGGALTELSNWIGINEEAEPVAKSTTENSEALSKAYDKLKEANDAVNSAQQFDIELMKAKGASIDEIRAKELELAKTKREQAVANAEQIKRDAELQLAALGNSKKDQEEREKLNNLITQSTQAVTEAERAEKLLQANIEKEKAKERAEAAKKAAEDAKKRAEERRKALNESQKKELEDLKKSIADEQQELKNAADKDIQILRDRLTAEGKFGEEADAEIADAQRKRNEQLLADQLAATKKQLEITSKDKKLSNEARLDLEEELGQKIIELDNQLSIQRRENLKQDNADELQDIRDNFAAVTDEINKAAQEGQISATKQTTEELNQLNEKFRSGEIKNLEEYEKEKQKILKEANRQALIENEATAQKTLDVAINTRDEELSKLTEGTTEYIERKKELDQQVLDAEQAVADARLAISEDTSQQLIDDQNKTTEEILKNIEKQVNAINELGSSIGGLIQPLSENFDTLGLKIFNLTAGLSSQLPALFETISKPIDESLTKTEQQAQQAQKIAAAFQFASQAIGEVGALIADQNAQRLADLQAQSEEELTTLEENKDAAIANIEEQEEKGVISKATADAKKLAIQQQYDANLIDLQKAQQKKELDAKRKAFNQEKAIRIAQAIAQGATAALNAYAAGAVFTPVTGAIFAGIAAAFSAVQIGIIKSQKFPEDAGGAAGGGGVSAPSPSTGVPQAQPAQNFQGDIFNTGASQQATQGFGNQQGGGTIRAYVVESDISSTQNRLDRIRNSSEL